MLRESIRKRIFKLPPPFNKPVITLYEIYSRTSPRIRWLPRNILSLFLFKKYKDKLVDNFNIFEKKIFSQNGEDGLLEMIFYKIGVTNKYCVEFGVEDGSECNTRYLITRRGWYFLHMDSRTNIPTSIKTEFVTPENVNQLFKKYSVPKKFDLLSIDIDSHDYWVWEALDGYSPRVVVIEYNSAIPITEAKVINPDPKFLELYPNTYCRGGASLLALYRLGKLKGYTLVVCNSTGVNAFFVQNALIKDNFVIKGIEDIYRAPKCGQKINGVHKGFPPDDDVLVQV